MKDKTLPVVPLGIFSFCRLMRMLSSQLPSGGGGYGGGGGGGGDGHGGGGGGGYGTDRKTYSFVPLVASVSLSVCSMARSTTLLLAVLTLSSMCLVFVGADDVVLAASDPFIAAPAASAAAAMTSVPAVAADTFPVVADTDADTDTVADTDTKPPISSSSYTDDGKVASPLESALYPLGLYRPHESSWTVPRPNQPLFLGRPTVPPLRASPCTPRHIHLSLGDERDDDDEKDGDQDDADDDDHDHDQDDETSHDGAGKSRRYSAASSSWSSSMSASATISFSVPYTSDGQCHPDKLQSVSVAYGLAAAKTMAKNNDNDSKSDINQDDENDEEGRKFVDPEDADQVRRYNHTSDRTGEHYESDWLYHVPIVGLKHNTDYWYQIDVVMSTAEVAVGEGPDAVVDHKKAGEQKEEGEKEKEKERVYASSLRLRRKTTTAEEMMATAAAAAAEVNTDAKFGDVGSAFLSGDNDNPNHDDNAGEDHKATLYTFTTYSSAKLTFRTAPNPGIHPSSDDYSPVKIAIVADLGQTYNSTCTMLGMMRECGLLPHTSFQSSLSLSVNDDGNDQDDGSATPATLVMCAGDMSYADTDQTRWDNWFELVEPLISRVPFHVAAGNHEIECDAKTRDIFVPYEQRFRMPNPTLYPAITEPIPTNEIDPITGCGTPSVFRGTYDGGNAYYAFTYGPVRFLTLSPYSDSSLGSKQYVWIEQQLRNVDRTVTPWIVVMHHVQFYTTFVAHNDEIQTTLMRQALEPLFVKYRVNIVICGHDHAYMRTYPMKYGARDYGNDGEKAGVGANGNGGTAPIYIIVGEGGNREHHVKAYIHPDEPEEWVERRDKSEYGFGTLEVVNATWARWRWIRDIVDDTDHVDGDGGGDGNGNGNDGGQRDNFEGRAKGKGGWSATDNAWLQNQYFI